MAGLLAHGIGLALVLGDTRVHLLDDIRADGGGEDGGKMMGSSRGSTILSNDGDSRSGGHCDDEGCPCG